jgi:CHAD domain-containing protein
MTTYVGKRGVDGEAVRARAYQISQGLEAAAAEDNWLRPEHEFAVAHDYDTAERDLERIGLTLSRLPSEAGVQWRLSLPRGECVEAWEPGTTGLSPPPEIMHLIGSVLAGKELVPGPQMSTDPGAVRLREMLELQGLALLTHDPGTRLGVDPENLHQHRVAARRARAFLRAARPYLDRSWRRALSDGLGEIGRVTGPVRDLDVLLEHLREEVGRLEDLDSPGGAAVLRRLEGEHELKTSRLLDVLDGVAYRLVLTRLRQPPRLADRVEAVPLERIARKEFRRLVKSVERLGKSPADEAIHGLRIALKRARYAAELAAPERASWRRFLADARVLQDLLGEHQDAIVAEQWLRAAAVEDERTAAAFVAGRIAERQSARRARVHERLPAAWKRLRKSGARLD